MRPEAPCSHPGCDRPATEIAVVESAWEDTATGSALMICSEHADSYLPPAHQVDATLRARLREPHAPTA